MASQALRHCFRSKRSCHRFRSSRCFSTLPNYSGTLEADYVIVGAGTAGCVLANRLSADPKNKVILLESGGNDTYPWIHIPVGYLYTMNNPRTDWCFSTTKQDGLNGRTIPYPRGKVLGGCSSINGMIYMRGQQDDYKTWSETTEDPSWGWENVKRLYEKSLDYSSDLLDDNQEVNKKLGLSTGGEWRVEKQRLSWKVLDDFMEAANECGIPTVPHFHCSDIACTGYFQVNQRGGFRVSSRKAFLTPVEHRQNLSVIKNATARKLTYEIAQRESKNQTIEGIEFWDKSEKLVHVKARKELILAAGAIGSPHILQVSGIGPKDTLEKNHVPVTCELPGVGSNLQDHLQIRTVYSLKEGTVTLNSLANSLLGQVKMGVEYALFQTGPLAMAPSQLGLFAKSSEEVKSPDLEYHVQPLSLDSFNEPLHGFPGITASVCNLRPTSRGTVTLSSPDVRTKPIINPNYLNTDNDKKIAANSLKLTRNLLNAKSFQKYEPKEYFPGRDIQSDEDLAIAAGNIATSIFHPVGTCKMGTSHDPMSVVDSQLRVYGHDRLRVVDASIMPTITSGNTNSPTVMIAEKAAEMILNQHSV